MPKQVRPLPELTPNDIKRFWTFVEMSEDPEACWGWKGTRAKAKKWAYGRFGVWKNNRGRMIHAHRIAWLIHTGKDPFPLYVLHSCDNAPCTNPKHLFLGTDLDNKKDAIAKGRFAHNGAPGERHPRAKFTEAQILEIREAHTSGAMGTTALARKYKVQKKTIWKITSRETWKHI
jgi:hypothetical protein